MKRRIVLVAAAVLLALVGTFAVYGYAHNADQRAVAGTRATTVLIAKKRVTAGTTWADAVKGKYLVAEKMPADSVPQSALANTTDAAIGSDAVAQSDIAPGQIVLRESFGTKASQTGVLAIPKGQIAISVSLPSNADVAGYVGVNSQVIIFQTNTVNTTGSSKVTTQGSGQTFTKTLVPNATVIATSQATPTAVTGSSSASQSAASGSVLLTLALSQRDAERVILAQKTGDLYLGLLSTASQVSSADPGVDNVGAIDAASIFVK